MGRLPDNVGFQNLYSVYKFKNGATKTRCIYTFRRSDTGLETPIAFDSDSIQMSETDLINIGENSIGREDVIGRNFMTAASGGNNVNGEYVRAKCIGEITDLDSPHAPDPTRLLPLYATHDVWLTGQVGQRRKIRDTPHGEIYAIEEASGRDKLISNARMDARYTIRNAPIEWANLEEVPDFKGLPAQRMFEALAVGVIRSEEHDYGDYRSDGTRNPVAPYLTY
jgi:hypothetical protein